MRVCRLFALLETGLNELVKGRGGFLGVDPAGLDFEPGAALGSQCQQVQDALAIGRAAFAENSNFGLKLLCKLNQSASCHEMEPEPVGNLNLSTARIGHDRVPRGLQALNGTPYNASYCVQARLTKSGPSVQAVTLGEARVGRCRLQDEHTQDNRESKKMQDTRTG